MKPNFVWDRRIVLTGGTGYVGRAIARRLLALGNHVHCIVRKPIELPAGATAHMYSGHLEDLTTCIGQVQPDLVIHCATTTTNVSDPDNIRQIMESNVLLPSYLLEAMRISGVRRFIDTGTFWQNAGGTNDYCPRDIYSASKQAFKDISLKFHRLDDFSVAHLRLFDVYGMDDPRSKIISLLLKSALSGSELKMSPGHQYMNLVNIEDVVDAFVCAARFLLLNEQPIFATYCVGHEILKLRDVASIVSECTGRPIDVKWGALPYRPWEIMHPVADTPAVPDWRPRVSLREALAA